VSALVQEGYAPTTAGGIAVANLDAQIDGLTALLRSTGSLREAVERLTTAAVSPLVDLLLLRGQVLGRIADYERATKLAEALAREAPEDGAARLARARTRATWHQFPQALGDLDAAERGGADRTGIDAERAAVLQAVGRSAEALRMRREAAEGRPDFTTLGALAVLRAERGKLTEAEALFTEARRHYRGVSPFPIAELDFRRGLAWQVEGHLPQARAWFDSAIRRVPAYAPALGHLAEVDAASGAPEAAIERLLPLTASSDDPAYPGALAGILQRVGRAHEAEQWRVAAGVRYHQLVACHPEAFAHHAADFWLTVGGDRAEGLRLRALDRTSRLLAGTSTPPDGAHRAC